MRRRTIGWFLLVVLPAAGRAAQASVSADTCVSQANGTLNFGALGTMSVGPGDAALIQLDLSALQGLVLNSSDIQKATLTIYVNEVSNPGTVDLAEIQMPWSEATVAYATTPASYAPPAIDSDILIRQAGYVVFDITGIARNWLANGHPNYGVKISVNASTPNTALLVDSKENTSTSHAAFLDATLGGGGRLAAVSGPPDGGGLAAGPTAAGAHAAEPQVNTLPSRSSRTWLYFFQGTSQAGAAGFAANLPAANSPIPTSAGGTDPTAVLQWPVGQNTYYAWWEFILPRGYASNSPIGYSIASRSKDSTNAAVLRPSWACVSTGQVDAPKWTDVTPPINITAAGNNGRTLTTGAIVPTCSTTDLAYVKFVVDTSANGLKSPFELISVTFSVQGGI